MKKILIKFPTRQRPEVFFGVLASYKNLMDYPENCHVLVTCDKDDLTMFNERSIELLVNSGAMFVFGESKCKIEAVNADMEVANNNFEWDILLLASDDMIPQRQGYDTFIRNKFDELYPYGDGALWLNDGKTTDKLNTIVCIGRKYYERFGYIYHPAYKSLWCDNEFTEVAQKLGKITYIHEVVIKNESPDWGGSNPNDKLYQKNNRLFQVDKATYERRKRNGFPA